MRLLLFVALFALAGCGGGGSPAPSPTPTPQPQAVIDPSGNWSMTAQDSGGGSASFAALFAQVGAVVTSSSFTATGSPAPFACVPFSASLANGLVQNVSNFTGNVVVSNFATFSFSTTLAQDGKSFTGTYTNMPPCSGLLSSGTFDGAEIPTTSGTWTGTLEPCTFDQQTGICTPTGDPSAAITASLTQNDTTGAVDGSYQVTGLAPFTGGALNVVPADQDILSGKVWQFTMTDASGLKFVVNGLLDLQGGFVGNVFGVGATNRGQYQLTMKH